MIKKILTRLLCLSACIVLAGCQGSSSGGASAGSGTLYIGVRDFVPGFGYKNPDSGVYTGLEIDIARALAAETGQTLELVPVDNTQRTQLLDSGEIDCVIATFTITEDRMENYDFSISYYTDYVRILVENSSRISSLEDLKGLTVGVVQSSTAAQALVEEMMSEGYLTKASLSGFNAATFEGGISFTVYDDYAALAYGLETGEVDAIAGDGSLLIGYKTDERSFLPDKLAEQEYGICVLKGSSLLETANELITRMLADGTIDESMANHGLKE